MYLARAAELDALARRCEEAPLKKRYMDIADSYRLLAEERRRHIKKLDRKVPATIRLRTTRMLRPLTGAPRVSMLTPMLLTPILR